MGLTVGGGNKEGGGGWRVLVGLANSGWALSEGGGLDVGKMVFPERTLPAGTWWWGFFWVSSYCLERVLFKTCLSFCRFNDILSFLVVALCFFVLA